MLVILTDLKLKEEAFLKWTETLHSFRESLCSFRALLHPPELCSWGG